MHPLLRPWLFVTLTLIWGGSMAQTSNTPAWQAGLVIDTSAQSRQLTLGQRDQGWGLGHSDLMLRGPIGAHFSAEFIAAFHTQDHKLDTHWENAWLQTTRLPAGWQVRVGRFASQLGYWNEIHPHADDFVERGLLERGLLGGHWVDDGVRVNWTAPTEVFLRLGVEAFSGRQLTPEASNGHSATVFNLKTGDDWGPEHSWQWGLSRLNNQREAPTPTGEVAAHEGPAFHGRRMWISDAVWKWAPGGNPKHQQLRLVWEWARLDRALPSARLNQGHQAHNLGLVWRFNRDWETGLRWDRLQVNAPDAPSGQVVSVPGRWREASWMVAYKPTDLQTLRAQWSTQSSNAAAATLSLNGKAGHSVMLQYVLSFGAHGAHTF
jgi:hypothetical protein